MTTKSLKFSKNVIYVGERRSSTSVQSCNSKQYFLPPKGIFLYYHSAQWWRYIFKCNFGSCSPFTGKLMAPLDCWGGSASKRYLCFHFFENFDLWRFLSDLQLNFAFFVQMKSDCKITVNTEFFVQNEPWNISTRLIWEILGSVTFLTWPWPWPELYMKISLGQDLRLAYEIIHTYNPRPDEVWRVTRPDEGWPKGPPSVSSKVRVVE